MASVNDPHPDPGNAPSNVAAGQKRKRLPRALLACESCRSRKLRCDQLTPCTNCSKRSLHCEYRSLEVPLPSSAARLADPSQQHSADAGSPYEDAEKRRYSSQGSPLTADSVRSNYGSKPVVQNTLPPLVTESVQPQQKATAHSTPPTGQAPDGESGFEEVNRHTHGTEYYGPVSLFSFLRRLRSRAHNQGLRITERSETRNTRDARDMSIVNLLHSSDFPVTSPNSADIGAPEPPLPAKQPVPPAPNPYSNASPTQSLGKNMLSHAPPTPSSAVPPFPRLSNGDIERECVRLFFLNLHIIHPMIDQASFISRCESEVWGRSPAPQSASCSFLALFNAVLAIGAINSGEDASFMRDTTTVRQAERYAGGPDRKAPTYPPLKLAKLFFEKARANLGDVFEACSLESTQTLFLMAVFCQNALKPHSCYLYCGMAVRCALAIGLPNYTGQDAKRASATWWGLYSFEIEMCAAAGRESSLRDPHHYRILLPHVVAPEDLKQLFHTHMIALAQINADLSHEITDPDFNLLVPEKSKRCLEIDRRLIGWKEGLPQALDFDVTSLVEPEWMSKQKVVLRNRFLNSRILIHRPFLIAAATAPVESPTGVQPYAVHVTACVAASVRTIESLYEMYRHRPYFRTWWYNTTYTLYASMILLYVILSNIDIDFSRDRLIATVKQSLEIFQSMDMVAVARRCAEVTQEVLDIAKRAPSQGAGASALPNVEAAQAAAFNNVVGNSSNSVLSGNNATGDDGNAGFGFQGFGDNALGGLDFLVDPNLMDGFAPFPVTGGDGFFEYPDFNSVLASGPFG